jgi:ribosomal protein S6--L-glutamate ligase
MAQGGPRIGVVGVAEGWSSNHLADVVEQRTGYRQLIPMHRVDCDLGAGRVRCDGVDLAGLDAIIVKKLGASYRPELLDRVEILHYLHKGGLPVFSKPRSIMRLIDRLSCTVTLRCGGIPMPDTVVTEDVELAADAVARFGKAVLKPLFTSKARGMEVVEDGPDLRERIEAFRDVGNHILYIQRMIPLPGSDMGIVFLGGKYLASYSRVAGKLSWNTSTHTGGKYRACEPKPEAIELADRAQALFDLDFTCVDVGDTPDGLIVFEVSAFGGFRGLREAVGLDAAERYVDYVLGKLTHGG